MIRFGGHKPLKTTSSQVISDQCQIVFSISYFLEEANKAIRFDWMQQNQGRYAVEKMAVLLRVSRSGYYHHVFSEESKYSQQDKHLLEQIQHIYTVSKQTYGSKRIHRALRAQGIHCSRKRVIRLMQKGDLVAKAHLMLITTVHNPYNNVYQTLLMIKNFDAKMSSVVWVNSHFMTDIIFY